MYLIPILMGLTFLLLLRELIISERKWFEIFGFKRYMMKRISSLIKIVELVIFLLISLVIVGYLWAALIYMLLFNLILFDYFFMKKRIYSYSISAIQKIINFLHTKFGLETIDRDEAKSFFIVMMIIAVLYSVNFIGNISNFSSCISQFDFSQMDSCYKKNDWVWERYEDGNL